MTVIVPVLDPCSVMTLKSLGHGVNWFLVQFSWPLFHPLVSSWWFQNNTSFFRSEFTSPFKYSVLVPLQWLGSSKYFYLENFPPSELHLGPRQQLHLVRTILLFLFFAKFLSLCNWFLFQVTILMELLNHPTSTPASWKNTLARRIHQICKDLRFFVLLMINSDCMAFHDYHSV